MPLCFVTLWQFAFGLVFAGAAIAATCGSAHIVSQTDADALSACPTITGNVILATNAAGNIQINGVQSIQGNLTNELCYVSGQYTQLGYLPNQDVYSAYTSNNCSGLASLSSSTLTTVSQNVSFQGLLNVTSISFPKLQTVGSTFYLDGLPALKNLSTPELSSAVGFHLVYAPELTTLSLSSLTNISWVEINDVGLSSFPNINVATNITSFIIGGIPNIRTLTITQPHIGTLQVNGNGFLELWLYEIKGNAVETLETLSISGCSALYVDYLTTDTIIATGNSFTNFNLQEISANNLYIQDNPQLTSFSFPTNGTVMDNIVIANNPSLQPTYQWSLANVSSLVLKGTFNDLFVSDIQTELKHVFGQFVLSSTNTSVNCSTLNSLRSSGAITGVYSCQGTTIAASSSAPLSRYEDIRALMGLSLLLSAFVYL